MKAEEFDHYIMRGHNWSREAFIPIVLRAIFRSIDENGDNRVPVSLIAEDFRAFYAGNDERKRKSLRANKNEHTKYVLMNIETIDEADLRQLLFERPFGTLGNKNRGRNGKYYEFIKADKNISDEFITVDKEIVEAYAEKSKDWNRVVNDYLDKY